MNASSGHAATSSVYRHLSPITAARASANSMFKDEYHHLEFAKPSLTPREQHWLIIDKLEECDGGFSSPATLIAAYMQLANLYEMSNDFSAAELARNNAHLVEEAALRRTANTYISGQSSHHNKTDVSGRNGWVPVDFGLRLEIQSLVFQFCIDALKAGAEVDERAVRFASERLVEIRKQLSTETGADAISAELHTASSELTTYVMDVRQMKQRIVDLIESTMPHADMARIARKYEILGSLCEQHGDIAEATQARQTALYLIHGTPIEALHVLIDVMEEEDTVNLSALSVAYAELTVLYEKQGDTTLAANAEMDAKRLHELFVAQGMHQRSPRALWTEEERETPRLDSASRGGSHDQSIQFVEDRGFPLPSPQEYQPSRVSIDLDVAADDASCVSAITLPVEMHAAIQENPSRARSDGEENFERSGMIQAGTGGYARQRKHAIIQPVSQVSQSLASFGSLDSEATVQNVVSIDCTNIAMNYLEDALLAVTVKLVHLGARFTALDKVKGHCTVTLTYSTGQVDLTYKWAYQLAFVALHDGREFQGKLHLSHMTKDVIFDELHPFPQEITWKDDNSPAGVDYNQVVAVLQSNRCHRCFREAYRIFEQNVIAAYMPRFQQQRSGLVYKNLEGKKGAVFNLKDVSHVLQESFDSVATPSPQTQSQPLSQPEDEQFSTKDQNKGTDKKDVKRAARRRDRARKS